MTFDQIQNRIFDRSDKIGYGVVMLDDEDHDLGGNTLLIPSQIDVRGYGNKMGGTSALLAGFGVRKGTNQHQGGSISGFQMFAPNGSCVGPHPNATGVFDVSISDLYVSSKLAAISLRIALPATGVYIDRVRKNNGGTTLDIKGDAVHVRNTQGGRIILEGNGSLNGCQVHDGTKGQPQLILKGSKWTVNSYVESVGGVLIDGAKVSSDFADWNAQPKQPVRIINGGRLDVVSDLPFQFDGGITADQIAKMTAKEKAKLIAQCYVADARSGVYQAGKLIVGMQVAN